MFGFGKSAGVRYIKFDLTEKVKDWFVTCKPNTKLDDDESLVATFRSFLEVGANVWAAKRDGHTILFHKDGKNYEFDPAKPGVMSRIPIQPPKVVK